MNEVAASHGARSSTALYGFVAWIAIHVSFSIFLLWAYTPDGVLVSLGVTYFPDKHWALALPCWTLVSLLAAVVLYATYNAMHHPDLESLSNIVDEYTRVPDERDLGVWADDDQLPPSVDLPITLVSRILHMQQHESGGAALSGSSSSKPSVAYGAAGGAERAAWAGASTAVRRRAQHIAAHPVPT